MLKFQFKVEHFIIAVLVAILLLDSCGNKMDCTPVATVVETTIEENTITEIDSSTNAGVKDQAPEKLNVIESPEKIERVENVADLPESEKKKVKQVNRYLDTTKLKGAVLFSEILSEGRILETNFTTAIDHRETTITTEKTIVKQPGGFFISPGLDYSPVYGFEAVETTLTYIKGNWGASAGPYYNFRRNPGFQNPGSLGVKLKIHIKL